MKDNEKIKIDEALSHIKKAIIEKDDIESENLDKDNYILLDKIVPNKNKKVGNKDTKKTKVTENKVDTVIKKVNKKKTTLNKKKEKKSKLDKKNKEKSSVDDLIDKEVKPIIKKWIDKNLRIFVKKIVVDEMKSISKATQKPNNR